MPLPARFGSGGHKRTDNTQIIGNFTCCHTEEGEHVRRVHGITIGIVNLKLAICIFMVNLVNIKTDWN
jgi:hypothetical protein